MFRRIFRKKRSRARSTSTVQLFCMDNFGSSWQYRNSSYICDDDIPWFRCIWKGWWITPTISIVCLRPYLTGKPSYDHDRDFITSSRTSQFNHVRNFWKERSVGAYFLELPPKNAHRPTCFFSTGMKKSPAWDFSTTMIAVPHFLRQSKP